MPSESTRQDAATGTVALQALLDDILHAAIFAGTDDQNGWFLPTERAAVHRLGLALEPWPDLARWVADERLDALFLHRPWSLTDLQRETLRDAGVGVLAYHLAFDERLTIGFNPALASACGWGEPKVLGHKEGRPLGMVGALPDPVPFDAVAAQLRAEFCSHGALSPCPVPPEQTRRQSAVTTAPNNQDFGVTPPATGGDTPVARVAVVGAMTDALIREAHARGVGVYVTGQWRQPAARAVRETGVGVVALGHRRAELWGLHTLARLLRARLAETDFQTILQPPDLFTANQ